MKKSIFYILILILLFFRVAAIAEDDKNKDTPVGMERIQVGDTHSILVPQGAKINKEGGVLIIETIGRYAARRFYEIEERIFKLESTQEGLSKEVQELKESLIKKIATDSIPK